MSKPSLPRSLRHGCLCAVWLATLAACGGGSPDAAADGASRTPPPAEARVPGEVLVQLRNGNDLPAVQAAFRLSLAARFGARPIFRFRIAAGADLDAVVQALRADPRIVVAEPNYLAGAPEARKRTVWLVGEASQYTAQWAPQALGLAAAHQVALGQGVRVAVLDTGVDRLHPALAGRLLPGRDFVDGDDDPSEVGTAGVGGFGHGTHVAGLVALAAPQARILPLRVLDPQGEGNVWVLAEAMLHAVDPDGVPTTPDGARVINLSLGTTAKTEILDAVKRLVECDDDDDDDDDNDRALTDPGYDGDRERCNVLGSAVVIAAAGNSGSATEKQYPAAEQSAGSLAVAASRSDARLATFSNRGDWIDVVAPGEGITSAVPGGGYGTWSGTSMASPLVAGAAALLFEDNPDWKPEDVTKRLRETSVALCGTRLRQIHADAAVRGEQRADPPCP
ncbi:MAG: S8 family serine peptidase [Rubrivivax sp.]|nr:S8 family serine peptidase [Rubrivivax sp.]